MARGQLFVQTIEANARGNGDGVEQRLARAVELARADVLRAREAGTSDAMIDRLTLSPERILSVAEGVRSVALLDDPVGETVEKTVRPNGMTIEKVRVPLGVIGMIYEARPNVTSDAFGLCFKTGNAVILKGGSDAIESNKEIVKWLRT